MKNNYINPINIVNVVELTADIFRRMNKEIAYSPNKGEKATQMHFVADLLKDLVDTAYPREEEGYCIGLDKPIGENFTVITTLDLDFKSFEEALQKVSKIMQNYKPPKAGEF